MSLDKNIYLEGRASDHPDIEGQIEFKKKVDDILAARRKRKLKEKGPELPNFITKRSAASKMRTEAKDHEHSMARTELHKIDNAIKLLRKKLKGEGNIEAWVQSKITRAADYLDAASNYVDSGEHDHVEEEVILEREMSSTEKMKEKKLKKKYDDSEMKQNMIDQYGEEKGTQIYFAKIRKMAMEEGFIDPEDEIPTSTGRPGRKPIENIASHPNPKVRRKAVEAMKKQMEIEYGGKWKTKSKDPTVEENFDYLEEKKLSRTAKRASRIGKPGYDEEGRKKPKGKVRAWDMDETLFRNDPKKIRVHVKDKEGKIVQSLTNQEFNTHKLDKEKGHSYDFDEFKSSEKFAGASKPNKSMIKKLKKQVRRGKPVHIVTARGSFDDQPKFAKHLRKHGIEIDKGKGKGGRNVHVHRAGDMEGGDIGEKKVKIVKGLMKKHGSSGAEMYDDAAKVHRAFKKSNRQTPTTQKVKTKMVQPNKKDTTQARSFKEEQIDFDLIYDVIIEQLIIEGYADSHDEASILVEQFEDDLILDLIQESYNIIESILSEDIDDETNIEEDIEVESTSKLNYVSPYKKLQEKKEIKDKYIVENTQLTPYEYWKSFIGVNEEVDSDIESSEEIIEEIIEEDDSQLNSYEKWKKYLSEASYK